MPFQSKYRHIFGDVPKVEFQYTEIGKPYTGGDGAFTCANDKFFGVSKVGGGGPVIVRNLDKPGRGIKSFSVNVHKNNALDFQFHPFINNLIGISSQDASASITQFPKDGLTEDVKKADVYLKGHQKKVHLLKFHPTANNIVATGSWDRTVKLWNVENGETVSTYEKSNSVAFSIDWNRDGSLLAMTTKKCQMRLFDPRDTTKDVAQWECMEGKKASKLFWVPDFNWIGSTGFTKQAKRMVRLWDLKNTKEPIYQWVVDQQSSILMPYYDVDTRVLYLAGKGDSSIFFNEMVGGNRVLYQLGIYRDVTPQKGGAWVPKRALDTRKCEVARFLKLTDKSVIPVSFVVPRKTGADIHQADIYPDTASALPSCSADEYLNGANMEPIMMKMDPAERKEDDSDAAQFVKKMTYGELVKENEDLKKKIQELENQINDQTL